MIVSSAHSSVSESLGITAGANPHRRPTDCVAGLFRLADLPCVDTDSRQLGSHGTCWRCPWARHECTPSSTP
jgi:hypothetical protein